MTLEINNVIIHDGEREYSNSEIVNNRKLLRIYYASYGYGNIKFIEKDLNDENAILYIKTNKLKSYGRLSIKNASSTLLKKYKRYYNK